MSHTRREFLSLSARAGLVALGLNAGLGPAAWAAPASTGPAPGTGFPAVLPLPGPGGLYGLLAPQGPLTLTAAEVPGLLPATGAPMLAYGARHQGRAFHNPILVLRKGQDFRATLVNGLAEPTIIHWHGVDGDWRQAGHPSYAIGPGQRYEYAFPVTNRAGTYWYHPHPHGRTAWQVFHGLASFFIVRDEEEEALARELDLALGVTDIPLLLQDKRFTPDGRLDYSPTRDELLMGFLGTTVLANGANRPTFKAATRLYRFRVLNGSTARTFNLAFLKDGRPWPFWLAGNDGGLLPAPRRLTEVFLAVGERVDLLLDLRGLAPGQEVFLQNMAFDPMHNEMAMPGAGHDGNDGKGGQGDHGSDGSDTGASHSGGSHSGGGKALGEGATYPILRVLVERAEAYDRTVPARLSAMAGAGPLAGLPEAEVRPVSLALRDGRRWEINGLSFHMDQAPLVVGRRGMEVWRISNARASMPHPMHLHGYPFRVLERRGSPAQVASRAVDARGRLATDLGLKDTVLVWPGEVVLAAMDFSRPAYPGEQLFLFHCHNLEHEDQGMMLNVRIP